MRLGHVFTHGGVTAFYKRSHVAGHPLVLVKALDGIVSGPGIQLLFDQLIRYRVVMPFELHVVIDMYPYFFPLSIGVSTGR